MYQSGGTSLSDWLSLFTLCLTPFAVHLLAGVPAVSYLVRGAGGGGPRWHDTLCHYNPTSILWRYVAITDRRIRARRWSAADMAAANALFWTARGWDGSEETAVAVADGGPSAPQCRRLPAYPRVELFSLEAVKTVVVAAQGCQAFAALFMYVKEVSLEALFFPLAIFGLARLFPALWLTDDYEFTSLPHDAAAAPSSRKDSVDSLILGDRYDGSDQDTSSDEAHDPDSRFRPVSFWGSRAFRLFIFLLLAVILIKSIINNIPATGLDYMATTTSFFNSLFYISLVVASTLMLSFYWIRTGPRSTIIPCISSVWYKIYTILVFILMAALLVVTAIETRRTPCGVYTTFPGYEGDNWACSKQNVNLVPFDGKGEEFRLYKFGQFGLATNMADGMPLPSDLKLDEGEFVVDYFTGTCLGHFTGSSRIHASTLDTIAP